MRKLKYSISRNALNQMYMSYLLPVVEYAAVVWDGCSEQDSQILKKIKMIELVFHSNLVFLQPLGYGILLMIT